MAASTTTIKSFAEEFEKAFHASFSPADFTTTAKGSIIDPKDTEKDKKDPFFKTKFEDEGDSYSEIFGKDSLKDRKDIGVKTYKPTHWGRSSIHIPQEVSNYIPNKDRLYDLVMGIKLNDKIFLSGGGGVGKSSLCKYVAYKLGMPFYRVHGVGDMESSSMFGQLVVEEKEGVPVTTWKDGPVTEAVKNGGLLLIDEATALPPEISLALQWLLEDDGKLLVADEPGSIEDKLHTPHPDLRIVCADNTKGHGDLDGKFSGTNVWNSATLDRFKTFIEFSTPTPQEKMDILVNKYPDAHKEFLTKVIKVSSLVNDAYSEGQLSTDMSLRSIFSIVEKLRVSGDVLSAFTKAYSNKLPSKDEEAVAINLLKTTFGFYNEM